MEVAILFDSFSDSFIFRLAGKGLANHPKHLQSGVVRVLCCTEDGSRLLGIFFWMGKPISQQNSRLFQISGVNLDGKVAVLWLGVKRVTEPNRTEPPDYTGQSLRKFPILAVPGFTAVTRT